MPAKKIAKLVKELRLDGYFETSAMAASGPEDVSAVFIEAARLGVGHEDGGASGDGSGKADSGSSDGSGSQGKRSRLPKFVESLCCVM